MYFKDRTEAGKELAEVLEAYTDQEAIIYALPRGGVIIGAEVAQKLQAPLDLVIVRKIGHPYQPEYAVCAISEKGSLVCNPETIEKIDPQWLKERIKQEQQEAQRRHQVYLNGKKHFSAKGKKAIIVDDGIATGLTMEAAVEEIKQQKPKEIIVAVPVIPEEAAQKLEIEGVKIATLDRTKDYLGSVGAYYDYFPQVTDQEVIDIMTHLDQDI